MINLTIKEIDMLSKGLMKIGYNREIDTLLNKLIDEKLSLEKSNN